MVWGGWNGFWAMGGYAPFVWGSYGVTLAVLLAEVWLLRRRRARADRSGAGAAAGETAW